MRAVFSVLGLLIVVAVIGLMAKRQLAAPIGQIGTPPSQAVTPVDQDAAPGGNVRQQSQQIQDQVRKSVEDAMRQPRANPDPESK